jgi:hypothetical protein
MNRYLLVATVVLGACGQSPQAGRGSLLAVTYNCTFAFNAAFDADRHPNNRHCKEEPMLIKGVTIGGQTIDQTVFYTQEFGSFHVTTPSSSDSCAGRDCDVFGKRICYKDPQRATPVQAKDWTPCGPTGANGCAICSLRFSQIPNHFAFTPPPGNHWFDSFP